MAVSRTEMRRVGELLCKQTGQEGKKLRWTLGEALHRATGGLTGGEGGGGRPRGRERCP